MVIAALRSRLVLALLLFAGVMFGLSGCGSDEGPLAQKRAEELVAAAKAAGVEDNLTVEKAEDLYGTSADAVCEVFSGSGDEPNLPGSPGKGLWRTFTSDAVKYGRAVVTVYCPDRLDRFERVVDGLDVTENVDR